MAWLKTKGCACPECGEDECEDLPGKPVITNTSKYWVVGIQIEPPSFAGWFITATNTNYITNPTTWTCDTSIPGVTFYTTYGSFAGAPTTPGTYVCNITATNSCGTGYGVITVIVAYCEAPTVTNATATGTVGSAFSKAMTITGHGYGTILSYISSLPPGLTYNGHTHTLSGTPTATFSGTLTIRAEDTCGSGYGTLEVTISSSGGDPGCGACLWGGSAMENSTGSGSDSSACSAGDANVNGLFACARTVQVSWEVTVGSIRITNGSNGYQIYNSGYVNGVNSATFSVPAGTTTLNFDIFCSEGGATFSCVWVCLY